MRMLIVVLVLAMATLAPAQARRGPATVPTATRIERDIEYARTPDKISLKVDLYTPKSDRPLPW